MIVGAVSETFPGERRVALVPGVLPKLTKAGLEVLIQSGAGHAAGFPDDLYAQRGARLVSDRAEIFRSAEVIVQVRGYGANLELGKDDLAAIREAQTLICLFEPLTSFDAIREVASRRASLLAMEMIPRISRAQSMDALSSMGTIAGYKAVLLAALHLPKMFPMMMTAAGTITPARVFVVGAGVAGLQAIASARRMGAQVVGYDVRPAVKEQVESLGAKFVEMDLDASDAQDQGGYAKSLGPEFYRRQRELMTRVVAENDVVVTTAAIPGKQAPMLITAEMVRGMQPGSVIVDLAAERGGNCELTRLGEVVVENDVTILGPENLPSSVPFHASQMYAQNITSLLLHLTREGNLQLDLEDEIVKGALVTHAGDVRHPRIREMMGMAGAAT